ncbi:MAG TPA: toll/interleukin-1 receptor domain-containing protein [Lysobacter sp.]|nr:toll/interleukin-1 receptor domain-containing protein [Lysobacter sp.]
MAHVEKTVFLSYRRDDIDLALAVYEALKGRGFDVFFDYMGLGSGSFAAQIIENIQSRAHFVVLLTPTALDRCGDPSDWLRREIEEALTAKRNVVPLMAKNFSFGAANVKVALTGRIALLRDYQALELRTSMFDASMTALTGSNYLDKPLDAVIHPLSAKAKKLARESQVAADAILKDRLKRSKAKNKQLAAKLADAKGMLAEVQCPKCGALQVERGVGRDPTHYDGYEWEYSSYACGYAVSDDKEVGICKNSPEGRAHASIRKVKFSAALVASMQPMRPFGDAKKANLLDAWTRQLAENGNNVETLTRRAEAHLATGNAHEAIKDIVRAGELGGLRFANTGPQLKAMILHIKAEWAKTRPRVNDAQ